MTGFGLSRTPQSIVFGRGQRGSLGKVVRSLGSRALICTDARLNAAAEFTAMMDDLKQQSVAVRVFDRTAPELPVSCVTECARMAEGFAPDVVVGIGGGSCMDLAKAVAVVLTHSGAVGDYYGEFNVPGPVLPIVSVPTTSGTGSEVTPVAVLGDPERTMKVGIASPHIISRVAVCDPELTDTCPRQLTAIAGADALTHAVEAFTAIRREPTHMIAQQHVFVGKNVLSDQYALRAIELISRSLSRACSEEVDDQARDDLMLGALLAGLAFGTAGTAAAHALQYPVGALTKTPHGTGVALLMPYVMEFNRAAGARELARIAIAMNEDRAGLNDEDLASRAIDDVSTLFRGVGLPATLTDIGVPHDKIDWIAEQALTAQRLIKNNPVHLDFDALRAIATSAFDGRQRTG